MYYFFNLQTGLVSLLPKKKKKNSKITVSILKLYRLYNSNNEDTSLKTSVPKHDAS